VIIFPRTLWNYLLRFYPRRGISLLLPKVGEISEQEDKSDPLTFLVVRMIFAGLLIVVVRDLFSGK
jgi:hypothetical protein